MLGFQTCHLHRNRQLHSQHVCQPSVKTWCPDPQLCPVFLLYIVN
jgi:hypothetical protein